MRYINREKKNHWPIQAEKKFLKRLKREKKVALRHKKPNKRPFGDFPGSRILDYCHSHIKGRQIIVKFIKKTAVIKIPKVFSFIENPDETLNIIYNISIASRKKSVRSIYLDHSECVSMDIGASICLDILCMELKKEWIQRKAKGSFRGLLPKSPKVKNILKGTGLIKHLKITKQQLPNDIAKNYIYFPLRKGYKPVGCLTKSTAQELAAQDVALHFNKCLQTKNFELSNEGLKYICNLVGEVIDNAEEHSGHRQWFVVGYMDQSSDICECELAIMNFGLTIYESLKLDSTPTTLKTEIQTLSEKHQRKGLFSLGDRWTEENLWTLYALQDGVSRWSKTAAGKDRGTGTVKMIEFFQVLGGTQSAERQPQMTLISGSTRVLFDNTYRLETIHFGTESRKMMTFNASKSLDDRPSPKHVHSLDGHFPGTLIGLRFYIDAIYLTSLKDSTDATN